MTEGPAASRDEIVEAHRRAAENVREASAAISAYRAQHPEPGADPAPAVNPGADDYSGSFLARESRRPRPDAPAPAEIASALLHMEQGPGPELSSDLPGRPDLPGRSDRPGLPAGPGDTAEKPFSAGGAPADADDPYAVYDEEIRPGDVPEYELIGEAFHTYLIVQLSDRLLMVDKHAAHERIIFDELCRKLRRHMREKTPGAGQLLLSPLETDLYPTEAAALEEYRDPVEAMGFAFSVETAGAASRRAFVSQIPSELEPPEALELFQVLAARLSDATGTVESAARGFFESRLWQASCKAAVKGGRIYDEGHMKWICDRLLKKPDEGGAAIRTCPHGRPVAFEIKKSAMDRQFGR